MPFLQSPALPNASTDAAARRAAAWRAVANAVELVAILAAGSALSWLLTGHVFGRSNNVFQLPIVAGLPLRPGFENDAFVQTLPAFASGLWMLLAGSAAAWPAPSSFAVGLFASKLLTLFGLVVVARAIDPVALRGRWRTLAFVGVVACTPLLQGTAYAGHGGLFVDYFSHSELANGVTLLMWWALLRQRPGLALALNGGVCFLNAFMAAWNMVPWLWLLWLQSRQPGWRWREQALPLAGGAAVALLLAAPVLWQVGGAVLTGATPGAAYGVVQGATAAVDLGEFVRFYFPFHFLAAEMPLAQWLGIVTVIGAALVGLRWLGTAAAGLRHLLLAYAAVYAAGVVLPYLSDSPSVIRLHLLRSSVFFHFIAAMALALALLQSGAVQALRRAALAVALLTARPALLVLLPWLLAPLIGRWRSADAATWRSRHAPLLLAVAAVCLVVGWQVVTLPARLQRNQALVESGRDWVALAQQVGALTPVGASVLLPLSTDDWQPVDAGSGAFEYASGRSVWVDHKRGAAVLWQPGFHALWRSRLDEAAALAGWPERLAYARNNGLAMVVGLCAELPAGLRPEVRAGRLCAVRPLAPAPARAPLD